MHQTSKLAAVLLPGLLPAGVGTHRLGFGRFVRAGAAHGAAAPLLAPRTFKLPGLPSSPPTHTNTHGTSRSVSRHCALSSSKYSPWSGGCGVHGGSLLLITRN